MAAKLRLRFWDSSRLAAIATSRSFAPDPPDVSSTGLIPTTLKMEASNIQPKRRRQQMNESALPFEFASNNLQLAQKQCENQMS